MRLTLFFILLYIPLNAQHKMDSYLDIS